MLVHNVLSFVGSVQADTRDVKVFAHIKQLPDDALCVTHLQMETARLEWKRSQGNADEGNVGRNRELEKAGRALDVSWCAPFTAYQL